MKLSQTLDALLVSPYIISDGETDRRMEMRALTKRIDFGQQPSGWAIEGTQELGALGYLTPYLRDGGDEDQFVQITEAGKRKAQQLIASGMKLRWLSTFGDGSSFSDGSKFVSEAPASDFEMTMERTYQGPAALGIVHLDQHDSDYKEIAEGLAAAIRSVEQDNEIEDRENVLHGLRYAETLWSRAEFKWIELKVGISMTVDYACEKALETYSKGALTAVTGLIKQFIREKLHVDIDTWLN